MFQRSASPRLPLRPALKRYWPCLLGITAFHVLNVFVPGVSSNSGLMQVLFFAAVLPAMWPLIFGSAAYSFWVAAALYWFFGYILTVVFKVVLFKAAGWQL
jgi:hypothetical protein